MPIGHALEELRRQIEFDRNLDIAVGNNRCIDDMGAANEGIDMRADLVALRRKGGNAGSARDTKAINSFGKITIGVDLRRPNGHQLLLPRSVLTVAAWRAVADGREFCWRGD